jgi:hypothetical protein
VRPRDTASLALAALALSCAPPPVCTGKDPLVAADDWTFVEPTDDTLWPAPPDAALCAASDIQVASFGADDAVEIDTRFGCGWATVSQPLALPLVAGDQIQMRVFYFAQATFPADTAEVALALDGDVVVREVVSIPAASGLIAPVVSVARDIAAGALAHFHVGNHGDNSWNLIELSRVFDAPCDDPH